MLGNLEFGFDLLKDEEIYDIKRDVWLTLLMNSFMVHEFWPWVGINNNVMDYKEFWMLLCDGGPAEIKELQNRLWNFVDKSFID